MGTTHIGSMEGYQEHLSLVENRSHAYKGNIRLKMINTIGCMAVCWFRGKTCLQLEESGKLQGGGGNYVEIFRCKKCKTGGGMCCWSIIVFIIFHSICCNRAPGLLVSCEHVCSVVDRSQVRKRLLSGKGCWSIYKAGKTRVIWEVISKIKAKTDGFWVL